MSEERTYKKVLFSGNGFDLSFGLPTKYTDFINVIQNLRKLPDDHEFKHLSPEEVFGASFRLAEHFDATNLEFDLSLLKPSEPAQSNTIAPLNNIWFNYFIERQNEIPDNWVDFETEIKIILGDLVKLYGLVQEHLEDKKGYLSYLGHSDMNGRVWSLSIDSHSRLKLLNVLIDRVPTSNLHHYVVQSPLFPIQLTPVVNTYSKSYHRISHEKPIKDIKIIEALYEQLQQLSDIFAYYLEKVCHVLLEHIDPKKINYDVLQFDEHLTVNYTSTLEKLLRKREMPFSETSHIHGKLSEQPAQTLDGMGANIVIGVDSVADSVDILGTEALSFTKYFQTLYKKTHAAQFIQSDEHTVITMYKGVGRGVSYNGRHYSSISPCHYCIWGHSLDVSDKKYIEHLFRLMFAPDDEDNCNKMTIYHYDQKTLASQLRNLLDGRMLGEDGKARIEQLVAQGRLVFELNPKLIISAKAD